MSKVKVGFIGCGHMGQTAHMKNFVQVADCEIVAVTDAKKGQAERVAAIYDIPHVFTDYKEMFAKTEIDAVVASQSFANHVNIVPDVLNAGKHLLTEKPLCIYPENGHKLAEIAHKTGKIHMVGYHKRSDPATEYLMQTIEEWKHSGELGKMKYVRITMPPGDWISGSSWGYLSDEKPAAFTSEAKPEGISDEFAKRLIEFVNYYIHQVNLMRLLLGDYTLTFAERSGVVIGVESAGGIPGIFENAPYNTSFDWQEQVLVCFERGWIKLDLPAPLVSQQAGRITIFNNSKEIALTISPRLPNMHAMLNQAHNFIKAVKGEKKAPCVSAEAVKDLEFAMDYIRMTQ